MKALKRIGGTTIVLGAAMMILQGCQPSTTKVNADASKVSYTIDPKTGVCFAVMGYNKADEVQPDLSQTYVPCTKAVQAQISAAKLAETRKNNIEPLGQ